MRRSDLVPVAIDVDDREGMETSLLVGALVGRGCRRLLLGIGCLLGILRGGLLSISLRLRLDAAFLRGRGIIRARICRASLIGKSCRRCRHKPRGESQRGPHRTSPLSPWVLKLLVLVYIVTLSCYWVIFR